MRSLQIVTPHIPCEYNCPFCIAKAHKHDNEFKNAYNGDFEFWRDSLAKVLMENEDLKFVVITGTNEPMQTPDCVEDIIKLVRYYRSDISIEIQTRDYRESPLYNEMDTVCYSISNRYYLDRIKPMGKISRYVIILTDSFNGMSLDDYLKVIPAGVTQVTFKVLQNSLSHDTPVDKWIDEHRLDSKTSEKLEEDVNNYHGNLSIRFDKDCMVAENRYKVFREDGMVYEDWDELPKERPYENVKV
jgi:organic radical activating enzyme